MTKITAIKNSIYRSTHMRNGNGISRCYHNVKNMSRFETGMTAIELLFTLNAVKNRNWFNTAIIGALTLYFSKKAVDFHNISVDLYPFYQKIVDRAKQIYKH